MDSRESGKFAARVSRHHPDDDLSTSMREFSENAARVHRLNRDARGV
jgi:hypothetical protein